jgi:hypothetical protein
MDRLSPAFRHLTRCGIGEGLGIWREAVKYGWAFLTHL